MENKGDEAGKVVNTTSFSVGGNIGGNINNGDGNTNTVQSSSDVQGDVPWYVAAIQRVLRYFGLMA